MYNTHYGPSLPR